MLGSKLKEESRRVRRTLTGQANQVELDRTIRTNLKLECSVAPGLECQNSKPTALRIFGVHSDCDTTLNQVLPKLNLHKQLKLHYEMLKPLLPLLAGDQ